MKGFLLSTTSTLTMKLIKQLASIAILILIFLLGYHCPTLYLYCGLTLCVLNYIHEDNKRFQDTFTRPYLPSKETQNILSPINAEILRDKTKVACWSNDLDNKSFRSKHPGDIVRLIANKDKYSLLAE